MGSLHSGASAGCAAVRWSVDETDAGSAPADVEAFRARPRRLRTYFRPSVLCVYEVKGRQYPGDRIHTAVVVSSTISGLAGLSTAKYPVGMKVDVHYNPQKPSQSVLHP